MRTITITKKIYKFSELSEKAKDAFRYNQEYFWSDDVLNSAKKGLEHFNCELKNYSIDWESINRSDWEIEYPDEDIKTISGPRLFKYIQNNFSTYYCKYDKKQKGLFEGNCPFTGVCFDEDFIDNIRDFMKRPNNQTFEDLIQDAVYNCFNAGCKDYEYQISDEGIIEHCEANGYEFDESGNLI